MTAACVVDPGTVFEDFSTAADWSHDTYLYAPRTVSNMSRVDGGSSQCVAVKTTATVPQYFTKTIAETFSADEYRSMALDVYIPANFQLYINTGNVKVTVMFSSTTDFSKSFSYTYPAWMHSGWTRILVADTNWTNTGGESWDNEMIRMRFGITPQFYGTLPVVFFDNLYVGVLNEPAVVFTFDDCYDGHYLVAYPYLASVGAVPVLVCPTDYLDTADHYTLVQLQEMAAGGAEVVNHSKSHFLPSEVSYDYAVADYEAASDYLAANGIVESRHMCPPYGAFTLELMAYVRAHGWQTARLMLSWSSGLIPQAQPIENPYQLVGARVDSGISLAEAEASIDSIVRTGGALILLFHQIAAAPGPGAGWPTADFEALVDYIVAADISIMSMSEWYRFATEDAIAPATMWHMGRMHHT